MTQNILYIINHMDWFWSHRLPLAQGAKDAGMSVTIACTDAQSDEKLVQHGFAGRALPSENLLKTIAATRQILKKTKPDIVHAITLKYAFITGLAALGLDVKCVHTIAGLGYLFSGEGLKPKILRTLIAPFLKLAFKNSQLIFQNPDDMNLLINRNIATAAQSHLIRGSGVDTIQFPFIEEPQTDTPLVIMPTRLVHEKGVQIFIDTAQILKERGVNARFQIAGGISQSNPNAISEPEMRNMIAASNEAAEWLGKVTDMPALYAQASIIAYPSYYREGIPKVLLEAASTGRAIITTDHPGCREAVDHSENGMLVPVKNAAAIADAIEQLLNDPKRRSIMGQASRQKAEQEFDVKLIVAQTLKVYKKIGAVV